MSNCVVRIVVGDDGSIALSVDDKIMRLAYNRQNNAYGADEPICRLIKSLKLAKKLRAQRCEAHFEHALTLIKE